MHSRRILQLPLRTYASSVLVTPRFPLVPRVAIRNLSYDAASQNTSAQPSRWTRRLIYATIFGALGVSVGKWMDKKIAAPPVPGTPEDKLQLQDIQHVFDTGLPIVQRLRANPEFVEMGVYENYSEEYKTHRLTSGALGGSRGIALQVSGYDSSRLASLGGRIELLSSLSQQLRRDGNQQKPSFASAEPRDPAHF